ncbi:hypothetical protein CRENBAI_002097 [Crenichthys baileyi]|uniref:Uncharacterized protein n=1 Tax=Crenichthys baileyi TaxID=28760 RepID=A0AAV9R4H7_9TELE
MGDSSSNGGREQQWERFSQTAKEDKKDQLRLNILEAVFNLKRNRRRVYTILGGEQLNGKEEIDAIRFPVTATPIKSEDDTQSPLLSQLYQDQIKGRVNPEDIDGGEESIRIQDHGDGSISSETGDTEKDEKADDVKHLVSEPKHLSDSGLKSKDMDNDWKNSRAPESDGNINKPF